MATAFESTVPVDEPTRLRALASFQIVDTEAEKDLDDIVALAAQVCAAPIATITFVDEARQWFKARIGLDFDQTPKEIAFCAHTVLQHQAFVIQDARSDPRFADNPLVTHAPFLRFYAGYPLTTSQGCAVGTLAVMDHVPRQLDPLQLATLRVLARQVVKWLELRRNVLRLHDVVEQRNQSNQALQCAQSALESLVASQAVALDHAIAEHGKAERLYRILWQTTTDAVLIIDASSVIRYANPGSTALFQHEAAQLLGQPLSLLQPERLRSSHDLGMQRYQQTGARHLDWRSSEIVALRKDATEIPVEISFAEIDLEGERLFVGFFRDVSARKQAEQALFEEKERAQATLRSIADGVIVVDAMGRITFMNPLAERLTGWSNSDARGRSHDEVMVFIDPDGKQPFSFGPLPDESELSMPLLGKSLQLQRRDGEMLAIEGSITRLQDRSGRRAGSVVAFRDVSRWRQMTAQLSYQATHDPLTGLLNRSELERHLQAILETGSGGTEVHTLLYLDLDQFKVVNDTCGHIAGDELLRQLSGVLRAQLRSNDTLARLGGDEFGVLLEKCPPEQATQIAEKLRVAVAEFPFSWGDQGFNIGVSIGQVCFSDDTMTFVELLSKADEACYLAKDLGRNRVHNYRPGDEELARRHGEMEWVGLIRKALKEERLVLYVQEIFDLKDAAAPPHLEVLLRMRDEHGQLVPPMAFIPAAERYNLMPAIDRWVIDAVCTHLGKRIRVDPDAQKSSYAINLSGGSVTDAHLAQYIRERLVSSGVPGHCICFEITETAAIGNLSHAAKLMQDLKGLGCRFSLDDFGSGMSSFAYLKHLPVDFLKIDGSFVRDIADDPIDRAMVTAIHQIGHLMGLRTIAEFVENDRILLELRKIGVDYGQGFGLAKPKLFL